MKIGYFTLAFPYKNPITGEIIENVRGGGVENVSYNLAVQMAKRWHEVYVFTSSIYSKESVENYSNITIYRYKKRFTIGSAPISIDVLYKPLKHEIDIVHAHVGNPPASIAAHWYAKKKKKPFVITYHGDGQWNWGGVIRRTSVYFYSKHLLDRTLSYADVIISPSRYYIDESRVLGKYKDKIVVIPNGINVDEFDVGYSKEQCRGKLGLSINSRMILFVGTLSPHKGPDILIKAMSGIVKEVPDVKLVFVGHGGMRKELEMLSKKLGVEKNVEFAGFVEENMKPLYYRAADVFCLPSVMNHEIFGIVNLEAMACSVPVVASKIGGVPDVVKDGENGLLVLPGDSGSLADAIIYLLENEDVREKMGTNGRKKVEDYSWGRVAEETEKVYLNLTE
jgi:glycosyltransferase involved in cell wall biosynthesis